MTYQELEKLAAKWDGQVCIFGAGLIGRTWGYDIIDAAGFKIDFYCDNNILDNVQVRNGIKKKSISELYIINKDVLIFITVSEKYQEEIVKQLEENGIYNYVLVGFVFLEELIESILASNNQAIINKYCKIINDEEFLKEQFYYRVGYKLNLENPQTFNEKIQWLKLHDRRPIYTKLVDKYEFKKFVENELGKEYVIPTLGVWNCVEEIEFDKLPKQFVLKCTHDSGSVIICRDKLKFDIDNARKRLAYALRRNYYWNGREWPYKNVKPRIIAEEYIQDDKNLEIVDYKFLCFNGKYKCAFTCTERFEHEGLKVTFFNTKWGKMSVERHYPSSKKKISKPINYSKMIRIAEKLAENIPFVRIDFYEVNGKMYLSEFTLYPGCGFEEFSDWKQDKEFGSWLDLENIN